LGQLAEADEEGVEVRLMSDAAYAEEFEILENELVDQYAGNDLSAEDRARCEQYFLNAPERAEKLAFATSFNQAASANSLNETASARASGERRFEPSLTPDIAPPVAPAWRFFSPAYLKAAAAVIIAVGVGLGGWILLAGRREEEKGLADLRAAYKNQRLIEARATKLPYAPLAVTRGQGKPNIDEVARRRAELRALEDLEDQPGAGAQHAAGRFYLADGQLDKAVIHLEAALKQEPNDAQIQSDLGASMVEQGRRALQSNEEGKAFALLAQALDHINKALQINPDLLESLYNKALSLQYMKASEEAREAWRNYLSRDPQSEWADEARRNLESLSSRNVSTLSASQLLDGYLDAYRARDDDRAWEIMRRNREPITGKMIAPQLERGYISSTLSGQVESAQTFLRAFVYAGELDRRKGGDLYISEQAGFYASASVTQLRLSAEALENIDEGYRLCLLEDYGQASQRFERARGLFVDAGNTQGAGFAVYWISYCHTRLDRVAESIALLETLARFCRSHNYKWLLAQAYGWLATNHAILSEHSIAIKYDHQSLSLAETISDTYQMQKVSSELGTLYAHLRQPQLSLEYHYQSLSLAAQSGDSPRQAWRNFLYTAFALFDFKYYEAAAAFANEAIILGERESMNPSLNYMLRLKLGQIYSKLRRFDEAIEQANLGLQLAQSVPDTTAGGLYTAASYLKLADIRREAGDCERAIHNYNQALGIYEHKEFDFYRYAAYKGRLLCALALEDEESVRRDLPVLLNLSDEKRSEIREQQYRNSFFDAEYDIYDIAVEYEHRKGDDVKAFNYAESARARSLLDALVSGASVEAGDAGPNAVSPQVSNPLTLESIRQRIPAQMQVVMYTVLPDKLLVWIISRDRFDVHEEPVAAAGLDADVQSYLELIRHADDGSRQASLELSGKLYRTLFGAVAGQLDAGKMLCVIPDKSLHYLPFAALVSPESGRYLIEDWAVFYAPSLNVLWGCSEIARGKPRSNHEVILSVGNPAFNREAYPNLPLLQSAEREARSIAALFKNPTRLLGPEASKEKMLRAMQSADVIHFAGHYVIDDTNPLLSKMLLAAGDANDPDEHRSVLYANEILRYKLDRAKLVVLSACQTGLDKYYSGEGAVGLSRTFIGARIPLVVASQWPVDSEGTAALMISFYHHRQSGLSTVRALREAQVEMLRGPDKTYHSPFYWAAFLCVGGYAEY
jgi:CHAT domain-containing protein/Flp pilus assembly protein TadD